MHALCIALGIRDVCRDVGQTGAVPHHGAAVRAGHEHEARAVYAPGHVQDHL